MKKYITTAAGTMCRERHRIIRIMLIACLAAWLPVALAGCRGCGKRHGPVAKKIPGKPVKPHRSNEKMWADTFGGKKWDAAHAAVQTKDGGYIVAGKIMSWGNGGFDAWILKLDAAGNETWEQTLGGKEDDKARAIAQTRDGGYIIAGETMAKGHGRCDAWVIRLDRYGDVEWDKTFGTKRFERALDVAIVDGGYLVTAQATSLKGPIPWLLKLDEKGHVEWERKFGPRHGYYLSRAVQALRGNTIYALGAAPAASASGTIDMLLLQLDENGRVEHTRKYEFVDSAQPTRDGGLVMAGDIFDKFTGKSDVLVIKLDSDFNPEWEQAFGGAGIETAATVWPAKDGGYLVTGTTDSVGNGASDVWLLKLEPDGKLAWNKTFGGTAADAASSGVQTKDGGFFVAGETQSLGAGSADAWFIKLDADGNAPGVGTGAAEKTP